MGRHPQGAIKHAPGLTGLPHTHHAGEDAQELAQLFDAVRRAAAERRGRGDGPHDGSPG